MSAQETAIALDVVIASVPGVRAVYRSRGLLAEAVVALHDAASSTDRVGPSTLVSEEAGGVSVTTTIGVESGAGAVETVRAVYGAVEAWLREQGIGVNGVSVTVAHVAE